MSQKLYNTQHKREAKGLKYYWNYMIKCIRFFNTPASWGVTRALHKLRKIRLRWVLARAGRAIKYLLTLPISHARATIVSRLEYQRGALGSALRLNLFLGSKRERGIERRQARDSKSLWHLSANITREVHYGDQRGRRVIYFNYCQTLNQRTTISVPIIYEHAHR